MDAWYPGGQHYEHYGGEPMLTTHLHGNDDTPQKPPTLSSSGTTTPRVAYDDPGYINYSQEADEESHPMMPPQKGSARFSRAEVLGVHGSHDGSRRSSRCSSASRRNQSNQLW